MAQTPEKKVKDQIKRQIKDAGGYYTMPVMTGMAQNGTPDILACHAGYFAGIEAKAGRGKPTKLQLVRLREILDAGGTALVINEQNMGLLEEWLHAPHVQISNIEEWE